MLKYKFDVIEKLKENGYTTYVLRKQGLLGEATIGYLRRGEPISWANIDKICNLLHIQPGDLLEHEKKPEE